MHNTSFQTSITNIAPQDACCFANPAARSTRNGVSFTFLPTPSRSERTKIDYQAAAVRQTRHDLNTLFSFFSDPQGSTTIRLKERHSTAAGTSVHYAENLGFSFRSPPHSRMIHTQMQTSAYAGRPAKTWYSRHFCSLPKPNSLGQQCGQKRRDQQFSLFRSSLALPPLPHCPRAKIEKKRRYQTTHMLHRPLPYTDEEEEQLRYNLSQRNRSRSPFETTTRGEGRGTPEKEQQSDWRVISSGTPRVRKPARTSRPRLSRSRAAPRNTIRG